MYVDVGRLELGLLVGRLDSVGLVLGWLDGTSLGLVEEPIVGSTVGFNVVGMGVGCVVGTTEATSGTVMLM